MKANRIILQYIIPQSRNGLKAIHKKSKKLIEKGYTITETRQNDTLFSEEPRIVYETELEITYHLTNDKKG